MPRKPDRLINKPARTARNWCFGIGTFMGFAALGAFSKGNGGLSLIYGLIAAALFIVGANIKTKYDWKGGIDIYK